MTLKLSFVICYMECKMVGALWKVVRQILKILKSCPVSQ
jgi:hypothetical protein